MIGLCADHCFGNGRTENEGDDRGPGGSGAPDLGFPGAGNGQGVLSALVYLNGSTDYIEIFAISDVGSMVAASMAGSFFQAVMARGA
jgi:hypothetical protein